MGSEDFAWNEPLYVDKYDRAHYMDPMYGDLQYDEWWQLNGPTSDQDTMSRVTRAAGLGPQMDEFSLDVLAGLHPSIRSYAVEALADRDPIEALAYLQQADTRERMLQDIGRTEWDEFGRTRGGAGFAALDGGQKDKTVLDAYLAELEAGIYGGAPSQARNQAKIDELTQYYGGRPPAGASGGMGGAGGGLMPAGSGGGSGGAAAGAEMPRYSWEDLVEYVGPEDVGEAQGPDRFLDANTAIVGGRQLDLSAINAQRQAYKETAQAQRQVTRDFNQANNPRNAAARARMDAVQALPDVMQAAYAVGVRSRRGSRDRDRSSTTRSSSQSQNRTSKGRTASNGRNRYDSSGRQPTSGGLSRRR